MRGKAAAAGSLIFLILVPGTAALLIPLWLTGWNAHDPPPPPLVRLTGLDTLQIRVESVLDERMETLANGAAVEHLQPWTSGLTPEFFHAWQPHLTQLTRSDESQLCLIDIVYTIIDPRVRFESVER